MSDPENTAIEPADDGLHIVTQDETSGLHALRQAITTLDDERQELVAQGDWDRLASGAADLKLFIDDLNTLYRSLRLDLAVGLTAEHIAAGGKPKARPKREVPGLGVVEVPSGNERKNWESEKLLRVLLMQALTAPLTDPPLVDTQTGTPIGDEDVRRIVDTAVLPPLVACLPISASTGWKVGQRDAATDTWSGLRGQGIDPDDYSDEMAKDRLAIIPKRKDVTS